jgi:hypothetical protein
MKGIWAVKRILGRVFVSFGGNVPSKISEKLYRFMKRKRGERFPS